MNVEKEPKSTFAAPLAASPWARAAPSRAGPPYQPPPALGSRPASSAGFSCWAARQQELLTPTPRAESGDSPSLAPRLRRTRLERPSAPTASSRCAGEWRAPLPGDLSRLSEPRHCGRPELKTCGGVPQRGFHKQRLHFKRCTPCMSTSAPIEAQPMALACWPSAPA